MKTSCATRVCRACVDETACVAEQYLTLRTGCERHGRKNPLPFPYFRAVTYRQSAPDFLIRERQEFKEEGHSFNPRTAREKGLAAYGQTAGCPSFLPPRRVPRRSRRPQTANSSAEVQRKTFRPSGTNPPAAVRVPRSAGAEKEPPGKDEPRAQFVHPRSACAEKTAAAFGQKERQKKNFCLFVQKYT